jgi:very-short-patch-repair endonuclease
VGALHTSERSDAAAKRLRRKPTPAEQRLWKVLKTLKLNGSHFRRQVAFGPYIVDFVCHGARLVVEVDGGIHRLPEVAARDAEREAWLTRRRYAVVRITNEQALF